MDLAAYGYLVAALLYTGCALATSPLTLFKGADRRVQLCFAAALAASAGWAWCEFAALRSDLIVMYAVAAALDALRYGLLFAFLLLVVRPASRPLASPLWLIGLALTLVAAAFGIAAQVDALGATMLRAAYFAMLTLPVFGLLLVEQLFREVPEDFRWHVKPLCIGLAGLQLFDVYLFSPAAMFAETSVDAQAVRGLVHAVAAPLLFMATRRHAQWAGGFNVSRNVAFHTATLVIVGIYLLLISGVGYYIRRFGGDWANALQIAVLFTGLVGLVVLLLSGALRAKVRVFIAKNFFNYRYDYRTEWLRFTARLSAPHSPQDLAQLVVRALAELLQSPSGALWSRRLGDAEMAQGVAWNMTRETARQPVDDGFGRFLLERGWIIDLDEYRAKPAIYADLVVPEWLLASKPAWLVVPLVVTDQLLGFVVLGRPPQRIDVSWEVRDLLKTASRQAASVLAHMQATEALLEVQKFDAFNRMSAFVVHDLKNIVTQLSLMMQNARRLQDNPEFRQDMLNTVEHSLEKMRQLMLQLREGEKPAGVTAGVELAPILDRICAVAVARGRQVRLEVGERLVARGHDERIARVLGHVVQNSLDASEAGDDVWVKLDRDAGMARVVVGDEGKGMTQEFIATRLFKPFHTTKASGMGIGAYESFQYIQELGGRIEVDSEVDRGTVITMWLPLLETQRSRQLATAEAARGASADTLPGMGAAPGGALDSMSTR